MSNDISSVSATTNSQTAPKTMDQINKVSLTAIQESYELQEEFKRDANDFKVDLIFIDYVDDNGNDLVFPIVKTVENIIASDETLSKEYLPILGMESFRKAAIKHLLGTENIAVKENRVFAIQTSSQTTSMRIAGEFLQKVLGYKIIYDSNPSWDNYRYIFEEVQFEVRTYRYWSAHDKDINIAWMVEDIRRAPENSVIILQASGHNPTGCDPTQDQWNEIANVIEERKLFPIFDCCFQGVVSGDFEIDVFPIRHFTTRRLEFFCTYSLTKMFSVTLDRVSCIIVVLNKAHLISPVQSHFIAIAKALYTCPPNHGALMVTFILNNPQFYEQWKKQLHKIYVQMVQARKALRNAIEQLQTPGSWVHITKQRGVFCFLGMSEEQVDYMRVKHHVYVMKSSRICISGVRNMNLAHISNAIHQAVANCK